MRHAIIAISVLTAVFLSLPPVAREASAQAAPPSAQGTGHEGADHQGAGHQGQDHPAGHPAGHPADQKDHAKQPDGSFTPPPAKPEPKKKQ